MIVARRGATAACSAASVPHDAECAGARRADPRWSSVGNHTGGEVLPPARFRIGRGVAMSERRLVRWSGVSVALGGLLIAAYMLVHPWAERTGAVATTTQWVVSHGLHFVGALLLLFGLTGLYLRQRERAGWAGLVGFLLAFLGTALFVGTGLSSAFLWPAIAFEAPTFVATDGGMFTHPLALGPIVAARAFLALGLAWLGAVSLRAG